MPGRSYPAHQLSHPLAAAFRMDGHSGEAFVLIHGFTGVPAHFRPLGAELHGLGHTVNAPLLAGHGRTIESLATVTRHDWLAGVIDAVREVGDHRRVHLVGLSMGGLLGVVAATRTRVDTLTTINSPVRFRDRRIYASTLLRFIQPQVVWPEEPAPDLDDEVAPFWIHTAGFPTVAAAELVRLSQQALRLARRVEIPSLVIQSKFDDTTHPRSGPLLSRRLGGRLLWLERSIHNALFDRERHVIRDAILDFARS
jgi:carboxylesterase